MSVDFETKYFNSIHNVLKNGQHPLVSATRNIVKDVYELGELVLYIRYIRIEISKGRHQYKMRNFGTMSQLGLTPNLPTLRDSRSGVGE